MPDVVIVALGSGNVSSIVQAVRLLGSTPIVSDEPAVIASHRKLILPGVGNFGAAMEDLRAKRLIPVLREYAIDVSNHMLGICLGMQLLAEWGTETANGTRDAGLGIVDGTVRSLRSAGCQLRLPHVGWNELNPGPAWSSFCHVVPERTDVYFVHSYAMQNSDPLSIAATTTYGVEFISALRQDNIWATQFHPEKSSTGGLALLRQFLEHP